MKPTPTDLCWILRAPRLNANDDSVTLTRWLAPDRDAIAAGHPIAEIETEKATAEPAAEIGGTLLQAVAAGASVPVGAPLAYVGPTLAAAEDMRRTLRRDLSYITYPFQGFDGRLLALDRGWIARRVGRATAKERSETRTDAESR